MINLSIGGSWYRSVLAVRIPGPASVPISSSPAENWSACYRQTSFAHWSHCKSFMEKWHPSFALDLTRIHCWSFLFKWPPRTLETLLNHHVHFSANWCLFPFRDPDGSGCGETLWKWDALSKPSLVGSSSKQVIPKWLANHSFSSLHNLHILMFCCRSFLLHKF